MSGKGSRQRPAAVPQDAIADSWQRIFVRATVPWMVEAMQRSEWQCGYCNEVGTGDRCNECGSEKGAMP